MELTTLSTLLTTGGATALVLLIVQYLKPAIGMKTRILTWLLSLFVLCVATAFLNPTAEAFALAGFNSIFVAFSAMGAYEVTFAKSDEKKKLGG